jgi:hypothetical protein
MGRETEVGASVPSADEAVFLIEVYRQWLTALFFLKGRK